MEIEEVIERLSAILSDYKNDNMNFLYAKDMKALETAIKILKGYKKDG